MLPIPIPTARRRLCRSSRTSSVRHGSQVYLNRQVILTSHHRSLKAAGYDFTKGNDRAFETLLVRNITSTRYCYLVIAAIYNFNIPIRTRSNGRKWTWEAPQ